MTTAPTSPDAAFRAAAVRAARTAAAGHRVRLDGLRAAGWPDRDAALRLLTDACEAADQLVARVPGLASGHGEWVLAFSQTAGTEPTHGRARAAVCHLERLVRDASRPSRTSRSRTAGDLGERTAAR